MRRGPLLDDEELIEFYDERLPADITSGRRFDRWWKDVADPHLLDLTDDVLGRRIGFRIADFPDTWRQGDLVLPLSYRFDPGGPLDGVAVHIPLTALNRVGDDGFDWQIAGHRRELVDSSCARCPRTCGAT